MFTTLLIFGSLITHQVDAPSNKAAVEGELASKVELLVLQLDDDQLTKRNAAEKALIELGPQALPHLPTITSRTPAAVKVAVGRVRTTLEKIAADTATTMSRVTLKGEMSLADALAAIEKQTGNKVVGHEERGGKVTINLTDASFWQILDHVLDQNELTLNPYGGEPRALSIMARAEGERPRSGQAHYNGIFRFEAMQVSAARDLRHPDTNSLRISMQAAWEPRTMPISLSIPADQLQATDETGAIIAVSGGQRELGAFVQAGVSMTDFVLPFALPSRDVKQIASVKGKVVALIPGRTETFEFADVTKLKDSQQQRAGLTLTFDHVQKNEDVYEFRIRIRVEDASGAFQSHLTGWTRNNECHLVAPDGKTIGEPNYEMYLQSDDEIGMKYLFPLDEAPTGYKFVYKTPTTIVRSETEFELKNIELP